MGMVFKFNKLNNVNNPKSIHGLYPYRGKISSVDATQIIKQFKKNKILLDPFCGSGTIIFEGQKHGMEVVGFDANPIAHIISKAKVGKKSLENEIVLANNILDCAQCSDVPDIPNIVTEYFHEQTARQMMQLSLYFNEMSDYLKACFMGAVCLAARGCNHYKWTSVTVGKKFTPFRNIDFNEKFLNKVKKHFETCERGHGRVFKKDARNLSKYLKENSINYVFTSPPYFDGLDYTSYHGRFIFKILGWDRDKIRKKLIYNFNSYEDDMRIVLNEIDKVTATNSHIIFVVGDKKLKNGDIISGGEFFKKIAPFKKCSIAERTYEKTSSNVIDSINKTKRKEQIIVWEK